MANTHILGQIAILFGIGVLVSWMFRVARAPSIIGFLITGMLIGPSALQLIEGPAVSQFADIGVVLLLFTVGVELSPEPLIRAGRGLIKAAAFQIVAIVIITLLVGLFVLKLPFIVALLLGIAASNSSTPIALKQLSDRGELRTLLGTLIAGNTLLQDSFLIIAMALMPLFASGVPGQTHGPLFTLATFGMLIVFVLVARAILPRLIKQLLTYGGHELTALFAVMMAGGGAWLASLAGWSPALGACVMGLLLANADVRHQIVADITPFRDVFNALFFISMGMLVNLERVVTHVWAVLAAVLITIVLKAAITWAGIQMAGWPARLSMQVGFGLCTVSEFAYVLLLQAQHAGLVEASFVESAVVFIVGTMIVGAVGFPLGISLANRGLDKPAHAGDVADQESLLRHHVIVVGYGVNGRNLAHVLTSTHIPYCVIEIDQRNVQAALDDKVPIVVGDAARLAILDQAGLGRANTLVVGINDIQATRRIVTLAHNANPQLHIVVRTPYVAELEELMRRGANVVVPADFEASVRIFSHVLEELGVPRNILAAQIAAVRAGGYGVFRGKSSSSQESLEDLLKVLQISATQTFFLPETSPACGKTLRELDLRNRTGATLIAVVRDRNPITNPEADFQLAPNDVLVLVGAHAQLTEAQKLLDVSSQLDATPPATEL